MSVVLQSAGFVITLPNPQLGNTEKPDDKVNIQRSMNGGVFTYVKTSPTRTLNYSFSVSRSKFYALKTFYVNCLGLIIRMTNWKGEVWYGYIMNDELDVTESRQWDNTFDLEFRGQRVA